MQEREQEINGVGSSLGGSFPSLNSSQSSGDKKLIPYVPPIEKVRVLKFEDTLSEEDPRGFSLIYESLLLEGRAGNLTDLTMGMALAENPPAWLQVMHERLKHLIISSETVKKKKRAEHIGVTTTSHLSARCKLTSNSMIGIQDKLLCSFQDCMC